MGESQMNYARPILKAAYFMIELSEKAKLMVHNL